MVWNIYMAAMTSCENTQNASLFFSHRPQRQPKVKNFCPWLFVPWLLPGRIQVSLWIIVINKSHNPLVLWVLCEWSIQHSITNRAPSRALSKVSYWEARPRRFLYVFLSPTNKAPYASLSIFFSKTGFIWDVSLNRTEEAKVTDHDSQSTGTKLLYSRENGGCSTRKSFK